jgi:hypothetical protein
LSRLSYSDKEAFVLLNNGVTVVADDLSVTGDNFTLTGFQIVNGCQTSHVLFNNRSNIPDDIHIPIKLIVSPEDILKNQIIKATNRQTVVKLEELSALTDFQKSLEQYYDAIQESADSTMKDVLSSIVRYGRRRKPKKDSNCYSVNANSCLRLNVFG